MAMQRIAMGMLRLCEFRLPALGLHTAKIVARRLGVLLGVAAVAASLGLGVRVAMTAETGFGPSNPFYAAEHAAVSGAAIRQDQG